MYSGLKFNIHGCKDARCFWPGPARAAAHAFCGKKDGALSREETRRQKLDTP